MNEVRSVYGEVGRDTRVRVGTIGVPGWRLLGRVRRRARWVLVLTEGCIRARWQAAIAHSLQALLETSSPACSLERDLDAGIAYGTRRFEHAWTAASGAALKA